MLHGKSCKELLAKFSSEQKTVILSCGAEATEGRRILLDIDL